MKNVRVLSGGAAQGLVEVLRPSFEASTGWHIDGVFGAVGAMRERLLAGDPADVMILSRPLIEALTRQGHLAGASAKDIGNVQTAIAVRRGDPLPAIGNAGALRAALLTADEIHFPDAERATAGIHFAKVVHDLGIADEIAGRLKPAANGATAMRTLAASTGRRPLGCTQATEILAAAGIALAGPLPPGCDLATTYTAAITARSAAAAQAATLIALLAGQANREIRARLGFL